MSKTTTNKASTTDQLVLELLAKVEAKKKQIGNAERPAWLTNCTFGYNTETNTRINLQTVKDVEVLVEIYGFIADKRDSFNKAANELGVWETSTFKYLNFTLDEWKADIKTRLSQLQLKIKRDELAKLEERVNALVSPEQRRELELAKLLEEVK